MTAAISRAAAWRELGQLVIDGVLPDPDGIRFQPGIIAVGLDTGGDLRAWANFLGAKPTDPHESDEPGHRIQSAHAWGWHGWTVQLFTANADGPVRPHGIPGAVEEVAGPDGAGSATAPAESAAGVGQPPADGAHDAARLDDGGAPAADPAPVVTGDGAAVTPDVWVARRRRGIAYHQLDGKYGADYTHCGRAARANGHRLTRAEAEAFGAVPCDRCYGKPVSA